MKRPDAQPSDHLSYFIRKATQSGLSYRQIAQQAVDPDTGEKLDFRWINDLANNRFANPPTPARLRALAAGLGVPDDVVKRLAAAQWLDYEVHEGQPGSDEWLLWTVLQHLNEDDKRALRLLAQEFAARQRRNQKPNKSGPS